LGFWTRYAFKQGGLAAALEYDNEIFIFGGLTDNYLIHGKSQKYNPMKKTWEELAEMPVPVLNHICVIHKGKFYIFGGDVEPYSHDGSFTTNMVQEYDPSTDQWRLMENMPFKRANMTGQKVGNYLYLLGGYPNDSRVWNSALSEVWKFNLDSLRPEYISHIYTNDANTATIIFPNPVSSYSVLKIDSKLNNHLILKIINTNGQLVFSDVCLNNSYRIGEIILDSGLYIYILEGDSGMLSYGKLIKK
jgi:N-acetylneuraminic acid mutarotase